MLLASCSFHFCKVHQSRLSPLRNVSESSSRIIMAMMNSRRFLCIGALALIFSTISLAEQPPSAPTKSFTYKKIKDVELEMIVHYPADWKETDKRPAIVFFFGGGCPLRSARAASTACGRVGLLRCASCFQASQFTQFVSHYFTAGCVIKGIRNSIKSA